MRQQIAAANWKMNLTYVEGQQLLKDILDENVETSEHQVVIFGVPFPYLMTANEKVNTLKNFYVAAQNCSNKKSGAYTGEVSVDMLKSLNIQYCIIGHSERREYFNETNLEISEKLDLLLGAGLKPIFCCGEPLSIREAGTQNEYVEKQLKESLFHLSAEDLKNVVIAYEPIWAIGTGKTATTEQAQEIHAYLRSVIAKQYSQEAADGISILYGGSVKANNAKELFSCPDVDGGLVGGASLVAVDFVEIIKALK
ncbi:triose-phosphate isomerase [Niabella drilacis]|uniref:Triosephosphate isomerase n=1 Tax=Niabella drilacis (strain DSM 25811 / CCM 8410 / CCUG 62505 / LMG 26954 / E90) TaxID=1285928 RepID=A0A1G6YBF5_NIADE|nr:triose-phosphate isomerase [Niabella drilacis]SDD87718.1 triosephosphate isomerase [Niabella drilacis]